MQRVFKSLGSAPKLFALCALLVVAFAPGAAAQGRGGIERMGGDLVNLEVSEITLESIDFRDQTANLSVGLDTKTPLPVSLKDFDYRLSLFDSEIIQGRHDGTFRVGGRRGARVNLPVTVNLRSIPSVVWNAFSNRGQVRYQLDTAFTLPLFVFERRFDKSFDGEVPLRSLVDAATILRASRGGGTRWGDVLPRVW
ncbi:MAG TPA: LEA type 2 family protein [Pyrinomonadaceae bacterium]